MREEERAVEKPPVVLIHGSWLGAWCWEGMIPRLNADGFRVICPTLSGCAERFDEAAPDTSLAQHVGDVLDVLVDRGVEQPILVGHSYGSMVAHGVMHALDYKVKALVVMDGFLPAAGHSVFDLRPDVGEMMESHRMPGRRWLVSPPVSDHLDMQSPEAAERLRARLTPLPRNTHDCALHFVSGRAARVPRAYMRFARFPLFAEEERQAAQKGWQVSRLALGHFALLSHPEVVAVSLIDVIRRRLSRPCSETS